MPKKTQGRKAWLVTWIWVGDHARRDEPVVAVFKPQFSGERVRELVQCLYLYAAESLHGRMTYALDPKTNPYPAKFGTVGPSIPWAGEVMCGYNPWLLARLVDDLRIDENGKASWTERPRPKLPEGMAI